MVQLGADRAEDSQITTYEIDFSSNVEARQHPGGGRLFADRLTVLMDMMADSGAAAAEDAGSATQAAAGAEGQSPAGAEASSGDQAAQGAQKPPKTSGAWWSSTGVKTRGNWRRNESVGRIFPAERQRATIPIVTAAAHGTIQGASRSRLQIGVPGVAGAASRVPRNSRIESAAAT